MSSEILMRLQFAYVVLLGACLGSFVNVVVVRLPQDLSVVRPRSRCMACGTPIAWYDNLPIVSYMLLRGHCRHCRAPFALRYWLIEVLMAGLGGAMLVRLGLSYSLLVWLPLGAALLAITFLDIDHWWVPDVITYPAIAWVALTAWLPGRPGWLASGAGLVPALLLFGVGWAFAKITGKEGLGLGDVKLLALLGLAVGINDALTLLLLAALQGALVGTLVIALGGHQSTATAVPVALQDDADWTPHPHAVPFGPFLNLAAFELLLLPEIFGAWHHHLTAWIIRTLQ